MADITISEARQNLSDLVSKTAFGKERFLLCRRGKRVAALVSVEDFEKLESLKSSKQESNKAIKE